MLVERMVGERFHRDIEGRPLREGRTPPEHLRDGDIEYRRCPFGGSRAQQDLPINASALRQTSAHWDEILDALACLRATYVEARGARCSDVLDLWRTSQLGSALPWWFVLRGEPVPAYAAALAKAAQGTGVWAQRLFAKMLAERWLPPELVPQSILELAEQTGTLVGAREVCAGSARMLVKFFEVLVADAPAWTGACGLGAVRTRVLAFGAHYCALKQLLWLCYLARRAHGMIGEPVEPPDFYALDVPRAYFPALACTLAPLAPDRSDAIYPALALALPGSSLADVDAIRAEVIARADAGFAAALG